MMCWVSKNGNSTHAAFKTYGVIR